MQKFVVPALAAAFLAVSGSAALASHCPKDMKAIDAALATQPKLSAAQMSEVTKLRANGEVQHKAGDHAASVKSLEKAMSILGVKH